MSKITGPLMSLGASGSVGGTITFAAWKGRPYARMLVKPANPKTAAQTAQRAMMRFLAQAWATLTTLEKASWQLLADAGKYSPFNAFVSFNLDRWTQNQAPTPEPEPGADASAIPTLVGATAGVKQVTVELSMTGANWGAILYRSTANNFTPAKTDVIAIRTLANGATIEITDGNLTTGQTYYYKVAGFATNGEIVPNANQVSATPQ